MDTPYNNDPLPGTPDEQYLNTLCSASASEAPRQQPSRRSSPLPLPRASASESARAKFEARRAARLTSEFNKEQGQAAASQPQAPAPASQPQAPAPASQPQASMTPIPAAPSFAPAAREQRVVSRRQREEQDRRDRASELLASLGLSAPDTAQMSRADLAAVLEVLLSADEASLRRLHDRPDTPTSLKTVIRRVLADMQSGSLKALHGLWDRLYGRTPLTASPASSVPSAGQPGSPAQQPGQLLQDALQGVLPSSPVSREAYIVIRDTLMR